MDISKLPIEELLSLKEKINSHINNFDDGYVYICEVFPHGNSWVAEGITNKYVLQELCNEYNDEGGFVNVYSTNPNLDGLKNNGKTLFIASVEDYKKWSNWMRLKVRFDYVDDIVKRYGNNLHKPITEEEVVRYKKELEECDMHFIHPVPYDLEDI
jgi:hypothetical protein